MKTQISVSFDVAAGGMERLRNQDEMIYSVLLEPNLTARDILDGLIFDLDRDDAAYDAIDLARPSWTHAAINSACADIHTKVIVAVEKYLTTVSKGELDKANPFAIEAPDDDGEGCSLFVYVASPLFRHGAQQ